MNCPLCGHPSDRVFCKYDYWIRECKHCHHRFAEINPSAEHLNLVYGDEYFHGGKAGYPDYLGEAKLLVEHGRRYGVLLSKYTQPGKILDVGSAAGFLLKGFEDTGWKGVGLEPNVSMAMYGRRELGLQIATGSLEQFSCDEPFDVVSMIQVIAHFFDIRQALKKAAELTRPGGFWLIETWDRASWFARLFGKQWHEYSPPSVLQWFSRKGLSGFISQFGFSEIARGKPMKRISGLHVKSLVTYKLQGLPMEGLLNRLIPDDGVLSYPAFDLFWGLFQKKTSSHSQTN